MPIILFLNIFLYTITKNWGILHTIIMFLFQILNLFISVCVLKMSYKAYKKGASPFIFIYGTFGVYPQVYGVGSIWQCLPSFLWIAYFSELMQRPRFSVFRLDFVIYTIALAAYCWFFYKKLAKAFDKDEAFAKKLFFTYPLAVMELAFGDSEYVLKCRGESTPKYIPKEKRVNTIIDEDADED